MQRILASTILHYAALPGVAYSHTLHTPPPYFEKAYVSIVKHSTAKFVPRPRDAYPLPANSVPLL